ncbi:DNA mismatch repair protein mlh1 [Anaeramoeba flamelloides]|uniref:DNA mismatch repair protein mlh1 n=1 Tax=Anaeramoeba flamelloides TaxID=1746091 RepID=A0AAV8A5H0_9EUKA|nr:DNA mismatch repair protein mlh1 [Anaeramoeba flamelloides]
MEIKRIKKLSEQVIRQIAAGEVVQRPSSALKELLENSLDAGSTQIKIHIRKGGMKMLRVIDNGCGIKVEDLPILCERFTTSKLRSYSDLQSVSTFGFRGEALSSISYVSHLTVTTQSRGSPLAYKAHYKDSKLVHPRSQQNSKKQEEPAPIPVAGIPGTQIEIENLFYNQPSRLRSLRNTNQEANQILHVVRCYSINNPQVTFIVTQDNKSLPLLHNKSSTGDQSFERIEEIYSLNSKKCLFNLQINTLINSTFRLKLNGSVSNVKYFKKQKEKAFKKQHFILFINKRLVENNQMKSQINKIYKQVLNTKGKPFIFFNLILPPECVDVNVHPTKKEVKFLNEDSIIEIINKKIQKLLSNELDLKTIEQEKEEQGQGKERELHQEPEKEKEREKEQEKVKDKYDLINPNQNQKIIENKDEVTLNDLLLHQQNSNNNNNNNTLNQSRLPISDLTPPSSFSSSQSSPLLPNNFSSPIKISSSTQSPLSSSIILNDKNNSQQNDFSPSINNGEQKHNSNKNQDDINMTGIERILGIGGNDITTKTFGDLDNINLNFPDRSSSSPPISSSLSSSIPSPFAKKNNIIYLGTEYSNQNNYSNNNDLNKNLFSIAEKNKMNQNYVDNRKRKIEHIDQNNQIKKIKKKSKNKLNNIQYSKKPKRKKKKKKKKKKKHKEIRLKTILLLIQEFESKEHKELTTIFREGKLISVLDTDFALIQHGVVLYLCDIEIITREYLYQNILRNFRNLNYIHFKNGISLYSLLLLGLNSKHSGWGPGDGDKREIADIIINLLNSQQKMLFDYFSIKINKNKRLLTLPLVTPNYCPDPKSLPMFILRLGPEIEWKTEKECFESLAHEIARFYTPANRTHYCKLPSKMDKKQYLKQEKKRHRIIFKDKIFPELQKSFIATQSLIHNHAIIQIAQVDLFDQIFD